MCFASLVVAPGPANAQGSLSGGMMRATTLWLLATVHGVTFAAPGLLRIRLVSASFHSTVRSSRTRFWNEWLGSVTSLSRRAPRRACSLIRRTFRSSGVTPDLCHTQWHGPSCSALPPRAHFSSPTGDSLFSDDFIHSVSLRFASLTSLHESGRFDAPFSYNELVAALSKCHESAPGADCLPYSLFKVSFSWWRHLLLSFFNLVLRLSVVPSAWKSSLVVPVIKRDGDSTSLDSYRPISLASCAFKLFEHLIYAMAFSTPTVCGLWTASTLREKSLGSVGIGILWLSLLSREVLESVQLGRAAALPLWSWASMGCLSIG